MRADELPIVRDLRACRDYNATAELKAGLLYNLHGPEAADIIEGLYGALVAMLPRHAHPFKCHFTRPSEEWAEHGSAGTNCTCEISDALAALAKAREVQS